MQHTAAHPFCFIDQILNLLVVDGDESGRESLCKLLEPVPCYAVHTAPTNKKALEMLRSGKRFHACIIELGIDDVENDEFYLLRHYAHHSSIIVVTGSPSPQKGATCIRLGARAVFDKGKSFSTGLFFQTLNRMVLINVVNHRFNEWSGDTLNLATRTLFDTAPQTVTGWADKMRLTDRQLRNLWHTGSGFGAKHVLFLFQCLTGAFKYYEATLFGSEEERKSADRFFKKHLFTYFQSHREIVTFLLS